MRIRVRYKGQDRWATVQHGTEHVVIEATTEPNTQQTWARLQWSGDSGEAVTGHLNRRKLSRSNSVALRPVVSLDSDSDSVEIWVLAANIEIRTSGEVPPNAAPFNSLFGRASQQLGIETYESLTGTVYPGDRYVQNMGTRGKIVVIATLSPPGVHNVVSSGWVFRRERWTRQWSNGREGDQSSSGWTDDTSNAEFLRLAPDDNDRIYDTDGPDIRWGSRSYEIYHNFRQWIEWRSERCSDYRCWHFRAQWQAHSNQSQQIVLSEVGLGQRQLPTRPDLRR